MVFTLKKVIDEPKTRRNPRVTKYACNVPETRMRFTRCVSICHKAFLKPNIGSGIKRFSEDLQLIPSFKKLLLVAKQ